MSSAISVWVWNPEMSIRSSTCRTSALTARACVIGESSTLAAMLKAPMVSWANGV
jgi:hypothetical protein